MYWHKALSDQRIGYNLKVKVLKMNFKFGIKESDSFVLAGEYITGGGGTIGKNPAVNRRLVKSGDRQETCDL